MKIKNIVMMDKEFLKTCVFLHKQDIPIRISYPFNKVVEVLVKEEKSVQTAYEELIKKYGEVQFDKDMNIAGYDVNKSSEENRTKFNKEINEFFELEFEVPLEKKLVIDINDEDFKTFKLSSEKINRLEILFDFKF